MSDKFSKYKSAPTGPVATPSKPAKAVEEHTQHAPVEPEVESLVAESLAPSVGDGKGPDARYESPSRDFSTFRAGARDNDAVSVTSERSLSPTGSECSDISNASSTTRRRRKVVHVQSRFMSSATASSSAKKRATVSRTEKQASRVAPVASATKTRTVQSRIGQSAAPTPSRGHDANTVSSTSGGGAKSLGATLATVSSARKTTQTKERVVQSRFLNSAATPSRTGFADKFATPKTARPSSDASPVRSASKLPRHPQEPATPKMSSQTEDNMVTPRQTPSESKVTRGRTLDEETPRSSTIYGSARAPRARSVTRDTQPSATKPRPKPAAEAPVTSVAGQAAASTYSSMAHDYAVLQTELLQWCFVNARAVSTFEQQKKTAEQSLYDVWKDVSSRQEKVSQMRMRSIKEKHIKALDGLLKSEYSNCRVFEEKAPRFVQCYEQLCSALRQTMHRLPLNNVTADPKALIESLMATDDAARVVQAEIQPLLGEIVTFSNVFSTLEKAVTEETAELSRCLEQVNAYSHLDREERSLIIQRIQQNHLSSGVY